jgi:prepilin-type processing-associated H-X9-DG protein
MPVALDYEGSGPPPRRRPVALYVAIALACVIVLVPVLISSLDRSRHDHPPRLRCASNLRQIGQGIAMYANENKGAFPDDLATVLLTQDITSEVFVCPNTNDTFAEGPTTRVVATNLTAGGHLSYVYVGKGLTANSPPGAVVAYERQSNHPDGMNVLYLDGHVEWHTAAEAKTLTDELAAGHNPPRAAPAR